MCMGAVRQFIPAQRDKLMHYLRIAKIKTTIQPTARIVDLHTRARERAHTQPIHVARWCAVLNVTAHAIDGHATSGFVEVMIIAHQEATGFVFQVNQAKVSYKPACNHDKTR